MTLSPVVGESVYPVVLPVLLLVPGVLPHRLRVPVLFFTPWLLLPVRALLQVFYELELSLPTEEQKVGAAVATLRGLLPRQRAQVVVRDVPRTSPRFRAESLSPAVTPHVTAHSTSCRSVTVTSYTGPSPITVTLCLFVTRDPSTVSAPPPSVRPLSVPPTSGDRIFYRPLSGHLRRQ